MEIELEPVKKKRERRNIAGTKDYISNKLFTEAISEWIYSIKGIKNRKDWPPIPEYVGECFCKLATNYSNKSNVRGYTYIDDMRCEAILTCVKYAHNFDPERGNAFAYFTSFIDNAFKQILNREKKQNNIKYKAISDQSIYNYDNINLFDEEQ